jgi:alpha-L-rhamnosidase
VPANTSATVYVPAADGAEVREGELPAAEAEGVRLLRREAGAAVYEVGSGSYRFAAG